ncbi:MAG: hypothetical protein AAGC69_01335 [Paracraurococcus sp.]
MIRLTLAAAALALAMPVAPAMAQQPSPQMSFFITSANPGKGGDLGGLAGADAHCQALAQAAGAGNHRWHAYLSTQGDGAVNARDRIGRGPWRNARGEVVADSLQELHDGAPKLTKQTALTERGAVVNGRGDTPNMHDILTGSQPDGTAFAAGEDRTCRNWTSGDAGSAMLGHSDRIGLNDSPPMKSWNSSHPSRGCNMEALKATGGAGLLYCFAAD